MNVKCFLYMRKIVSLLIIYLFIAINYLFICHLFEIFIIYNFCSRLSSHFWQFSQKHNKHKKVHKYINTAKLRCCCNLALGTGFY